jgi:hypothetical protein
MNRPPFEVADIIRAYGNSFIEKKRSWLTWLHLRVLFAIEHCRTAALGGHLDRCCQSRTPQLRKRTPEIPVPEGLQCMAITVCAPPRPL